MGLVLLVDDDSQTMCLFSFIVLICVEESIVDSTFGQLPNDRGLLFINIIMPLFKQCLCTLPAHSRA